MAGKIFGTGGPDDEQDRGKIRLTLDDLTRDAERGMSRAQQKRIEEQVRKSAEDVAKRFSAGMESVSGNLFGDAFDASKYILNIMDEAEMRAFLPSRLQEAVSILERSVWQTAMDVWDYPSGIRFTVTRQEAQASTLFTVEYMDPEQEAGALVEGTVEFRDEQLEEARSGPELILQRELERLKDQCDADMAAFEPDGEEG